MYEWTAVVTILTLVGQLGVGEGPPAQTLIVRRPDMIRRGRSIDGKHQRCWAKSTELHMSGGFL